MMALRSAESTRDLNFGGLIHEFHPNIKKLARKLEKITNKIVKQETSVLFNSTCIYLYADEAL